MAILPYDSLKNTLPPGVTLVAATKGRSVEEIIAAGVRIAGENYVQEAEQKISRIGDRISWHMIGHLQKNKVRRAVELFDMVQTVDSCLLARQIDSACESIGRVMPILIEVNSGREQQKSGVLPGDVERLVNDIMKFPHVRLQGLMTMGPKVVNAEALRPFYKEMCTLFKAIGNRFGSQLDWKHLSMGMSGSYRVAMAEGATMVRIGTALFGARA
ncbi:MAG: YggS family pyridoxal phosphate-dependent enzyme [Patescibacteria group bacterium]